MGAHVPKGAIEKMRTNSAVLISVMNIATSFCWTSCVRCGSGNADAQSCIPSMSCCCEVVLTHVLAAGVTWEVTTAAQELDAALSVVTLVPGATQGTGATSLPQGDSGEDTQMPTAPSATQMLVATGTSSAVNTPEVEGKGLLQVLKTYFHMRWYI